MTHAVLLLLLQMLPLVVSGHLASHRSHPSW
jgi:hypothetical protein